MLLISHPTGNEFVRALLAGCQASGLDFELHTTVACSNSDWCCRLAPARVRTALLRRDFPVARHRIKTHPVRQCVRLISAFTGPRWLTAHEEGWASVDAVYQDLDRHVASKVQRAKGKIRCVHAYEDGALETFVAAHASGIRCHYELPIAYWETSQRLLREEAQRLPEWEPTLIGTRDSDAKLQRKTKELELADVVICPSQFVQRSLPQAARARSVVAEFGSPIIEVSGQKLRLLFVGLLTQRKGLADLFAAMRLLKQNDVELVVMGSLLAPMEFYRQQFADFVYEPPRPHQEVLELMRSCEVLALPSIVEGRALVQQEALACGLPLLVTPNAGGEDLIIPAQTGFFVPIRAPEQLAERIAWFADHRFDLPAMREQARLKAASLTWERYAQKILTTLPDGMVPGERKSHDWPQENTARRSPTIS